MKRILLVITSFALIYSLVYLAPASAYSFEVNLTLDNINNNVYIPGIGENTSSTLGTGTTYLNPTNYYLASYLANILYALVFSSGNPISITTSSTSTSHSLTLTQNLTNSKVFLVFTRGDWRKIENRIEMVEAGDFLTNIEPTFGYTLGIYYLIKILLDYKSIDIQNDFVIHKGHHEMIIESNRTNSQKAIIPRRIL